MVGACPEIASRVMKRRARVARLTVRRGAHYAVVKVRGATVDAERRAELEEQFAVRTAEDVARELGNMKGAIMKLGQMVSFIADGLPPEAQAALATLQQDVPPMAPSLAEQVAPRGARRVARTQLFLDWDPVPVAAASIGQVHRAVLRDGREVAVKVQYPGVGRRRSSTTSTTPRCSTGCSRAWRCATSTCTRWSTSCVPACATSSTTARGRVSDRVRRRATAVIPSSASPRSYRSCRAERVLTTDWVDGMGWTEFERVATQPQRQHAAEVVFRFAQGSVHRDRVFNGDPHPGNYRFHHDGTVTFLDFGLVKRWSEADFDLVHARARSGARPRRGRRCVDGMVAVGFLAADHGLDPEHVFECVGMPYRAYFDDEFTFTPLVHDRGPAGR